MSEQTKQEVVRELARHQLLWVGPYIGTCSCRGWRSSSDAENGHLAHVAEALLESGLLGWESREAVAIEAAATALDEAASAIYNGAGDPEQELYDHGASPWLTLRALTIRAAAAAAARASDP